MANQSTVFYIIIGILIGIYSCRNTQHKQSYPVKHEIIKQVVVMNTNVPSRQTNEFIRLGHLYAGSRILPLFGRQVHVGSHMWHYYTMSDGPIPVRLSFQNGGRACDTEYGCGEIYDGDSIFIAEYNTVFTASIVKNNYLRYNPYGT
jgi:hypothetical protein